MLFLLFLLFLPSIQSSLTNVTLQCYSIDPRSTTLPLSKTSPSSTTTNHDRSPTPTSKSTFTSPSSSFTSQSSNTQCLCGTTLCSTNMTCNASKTINNCQPILHKCSYDDGSLPNGEQCQCGTRRCDQSSGLVCNALQSWCSKSECSKTALRASQKMNPIEQKDENTTYPENTCEKFSPRCKCTRCKTNHYGSKCGKCPSSKLVAWVYDGFLIWFVGLNLFLALTLKQLLLTRTNISFFYLNILFIRHLLYRHLLYITIG